MKKIKLVLVLLVFSVIITAQETSSKTQKNLQKSEQKSAVEKRQAEELAQLTKQLSLTPEQQASIAKLQQNLNNAAKASREATKDDPERKAKRKQMMLLRKEYDANIMAVLTPKQKKKYEAILKANQEEIQRQNAKQENQGENPDSNGGDE